MADKTIREKLKVIVSHAKKDDVNLCVVAYKMLNGCEPEERANAFEEFIKNVKRNESDGSMKLPIVISEREEALLMSRYSSYVDRKLEQLFGENPEEKVFYSKLAEFIFSDEMLQDGKAGSIAIYDCVIDKRLPYRRIDTTKAITLDEKQLEDVMDAIGKETLGFVDRIIQFDFEQKTEMAGVLLDLMDSMNCREEKAIIMIKAFNHYETIASEVL